MAKILVLAKFLINSSLVFITLIFTRLIFISHKKISLIFIRLIYIRLALCIMGLNIIGLNLLCSEQSYAQSNSRSQVDGALNPAIKNKQPAMLANDVSKKPIDIFKASLHPFMQKNCSECHGDNAIYPVGPKHSSSDPQIAFEVFTKLLDPNDYVNSRFIKFASNRHYCKDHGYNCSNQDKVNTELNELFTNYVAAVTAHSKADEPKSWELNSKDITTHSEQIQVGHVALTLTTKVRKFKPDFIKVVHISLSSHQKIDLTLDGIEIKVNGYLPTKATGLELLQRDLSFDGIGLMRAKLTMTREVILKAKPGDKLSI